MSEYNRGFTLIEVLLAILLISVGSLATTKLLGSVVGSNHSSGARVEMAVVAQNILNSTAAAISSGQPAAGLAVVNQPYAGNVDILYDVVTNVLPAPLAGMPNEVTIRVVVRHVGLTRRPNGAQARGQVTMQTVVMTPQ